ncbi:MAG: SurA N-terminal domain-containing protein [Clostridia bacterium]|nr:SurA N-terminal domain-containing protein [Clostridia bacterium]
MKRIAALFLALLFSLSLFSCSSEKLGGLRTEKGEGYPASFLTFDGKKVEFSEFRYYYLNYRDMYLAEDPEHFSKEGSETALKDEILQCLLDQYALAALIREKDIRLDRDEKAALKTQIEEARAPFESEEAFLESLHASYMTEAHFKRMMEQSALSQKLFDVLFAKGARRSLTTRNTTAFSERITTRCRRFSSPMKSRRAI